MALDPGGYLNNFDDFLARIRAQQGGTLPPGSYNPQYGGWLSGMQRWIEPQAGGAGIGNMTPPALPGGIASGGGSLPQRVPGAPNLAPRTWADVIPAELHGTQSAGLGSVRPASPLPDGRLFNPITAVEAPNPATPVFRQIAGQASSPIANPSAFGRGTLGQVVRPPAPLPQWQGAIQPELPFRPMATYGDLVGQPYVPGSTALEPFHGGVPATTGGMPARPIPESGLGAGGWNRVGSPYGTGLDVVPGRGPAGGGPTIAGNASNATFGGKATFPGASMGDAASGGVGRGGVAGSTTYVPPPGTGTTATAAAETAGTTAAQTAGTVAKQGSRFGRFMGAIGAPLMGVSLGNMATASEPGHQAVNNFRTLDVHDPEAGTAQKLGKLAVTGLAAPLAYLGQGVVNGDWNPMNILNPMGETNARGLGDAITGGGGPESAANPNQAKADAQALAESAQSRAAQQEEAQRALAIQSLVMQLAPQFLAPQQRMNEDYAMAMQGLIPQLPAYQQPLAQKQLLDFGQTAERGIGDQYAALSMIPTQMAMDRESSIRKQVQQQLDQAMIQQMMNGGGAGGTSNPTSLIEQAQAAAGK